MIYSIYDPKTGLIVSQVRDPRQIAGRDYVTGDYAPGSWYVSKGQIKPIPPKPQSAPQIKWTWNTTNEQWQIDNKSTEQAARKIRQNLFADVDKVNPMWYASMTPEQQAQVTAYRQAILDITDQPGWPTQIDWPVKPAWL